MTRFTRRSSAACSRPGSAASRRSAMASASIRCRARAAGVPAPPHAVTSFVNGRGAPVARSTALTTGARHVGHEVCACALSAVCCAHLSKQSTQNSCAPEHSRRTATAESMQISHRVPSPGGPVGQRVSPEASLGGGAGSGAGAAATSGAAGSGRRAGEGVTGDTSAEPRLLRRSASAASNLRAGPIGRPSSLISSRSSVSRQASSMHSRRQFSR